MQTKQITMTPIYLQEEKMAIDAARQSYNVQLDRALKVEQNGFVWDSNLNLFSWQNGAGIAVFSKHSLSLDSDDDFNTELAFAVQQIEQLKNTELPQVTPIDLQNTEDAELQRLSNFYNGWFTDTAAAAIISISEIPEFIDGDIADEINQLFPKVAQLKSNLLAQINQFIQTNFITLNT